MKDTARFAIGRRLGEGGMGVVYEAFDNERKERVALKALRHADGKAVYRLKQEFRTLLDVAHPNLVTLYELLGEEDRWFFTMELIDGVTFLEYVASKARSRGAGAPGGFDENALRRALVQLTDAVRALHEAGKIHRDVKPSNVLVTHEGRVVVLDFGISVDDRERTLHTRTDAWAQGTAHYMSPEQVEGEGVSTASDWYSIGVMLFEALTATLPFNGSPINVMYRKQQEDAPKVRDLNPGAPVDLARLCDLLLSRDPLERPDGTGVLELLGEAQTATPATYGVRDRIEFIGRESQLAELEDALLLTREGRPVTVYLHGLSGMGKSTVVEHFLADVRSRHDAVVLTGRCYDRESLPYNAFDGVIDSLARYLRSLGDDELFAILPREIELLYHLFPVQLPIGSLGHDTAAAPKRPEPHELRRRAIEALRTMLSRIAERHPLVVHVDDWHWSDADSVSLGTDLLRGKQRPSLLLIVSFRSEEIRSRPFLNDVLGQSASLSRRELVLGPMSDSEATRLADAHLGPGRADRWLREAIVREARGSPFFIEQLCRHAREVEGERVTSLPDLLDARLERLPDGSREFLQTLAVAGRPIDFAVAQRAAGLNRPSADVRGIVAALRVARLIRASARTDWLEVYHDRIRQAVATRVAPPEAALIHSRLAEALAEAAESHPETLFEHLREAGRSREAGRQAVRAAQRAVQALAYDRAVSLYRQAIEIGSEDVDEMVAWQEGLAEALAASGHPGDAAKIYMQAAEKATSREAALNLRRSAAEQYLIGGHNREGMSVTRALLSQVGLHTPRSDWLILPALAFRRAQIFLRGLHYDVRTSSDLGPIDALRMDICHSLALGLTMTDYIVAAYFQARYLLLALRAGEGRRLARALTFEAAFLAAVGSRTRARAAEVLEEGRKLAEQYGTPAERALVLATAGGAGVLQGRYREAADYCSEAERLLKEECSGARWELTTCQTFHIFALTYLGRTAEVSRIVPELLESAQRRGNLFEEVELRTGPNVYWLFRDEPAEARQQLAEAMSLWSRDRFFRPDYNWFRAEVQIDLYTGEPSVAWARLRRYQTPLRRAQLLRVQFFRVQYIHLWGRVAVATAARGYSKERRLRFAEKCARRLDREQVAWARGFGALLRAAASAQRGNLDAALERLSEGVAFLEESDVFHYSRAARRQLGLLVGGDEGARMVREADAFMEREAIVSPARLTGMLIPGFDG